MFGQKMLLSASLAVAATVGILVAPSWTPELQVEAKDENSVSFNLDGNEVAIKVSEQKGTYEKESSFITAVYKSFIKLEDDSKMDIEAWSSLLGTGYENSLDKIQGDIVISKDKKHIGVVKNENTIWYGTINGVEETTFENFGDYTIYHVVKNSYEEPDIQKSSQYKTEEISLGTANGIHITKKDTDTAAYLDGSVFALYVTNVDGNWVKVADITTKADGTVDKTSIEATEVVSTTVYNEKEWITNYDKISLDNQAKYKDMAKSEPADTVTITEEELQAELNQKVAEAKSKQREWHLIEEESPSGYLRSTETWSDKITDGVINLPTLDLETTKIIETVQVADSVSLTANFSLNLKMTDSTTGELLNGGKYAIYVSDANGTDGEYKLLTKDATLVDGFISGDYTITPDKEQLIKSDNIEYVTNFGALPDYAREMYADYPKSSKVAIERAEEQLQEKITEVKADYESRNRKVKIVELEAPDSYMSIDDLVYDITAGEVTEEVSRNGSEELVVKIVDSKGNYIEGAEISVATANGKLPITEFTSTTDKQEVEGVRANTSYVITENKAPDGYVTLTNNVKTITSNILGEVKETFIVHYKATYTNKLKGTHIGVYNAETNELVDEWYSNGETHNIKNLRQGVTYVLKELDTVAGYAKNADKTFVVNNKDVNLTATITEIRLNLCINNTDSTFAIYQGDEIIDTWNTSQKIIELDETQKSKLQVTGSLDLDKITIKRLDSLYYEYLKENEDGSVERHIIDRNGIERAYLPTNLSVGQTYTIVQTKTDSALITTSDYTFTVKTEKDIEYTVSNGCMSVSLKDTLGYDIKGVKMQILDADTNEIVEEWLATGQIYHPNNLKAGKSYNIQPDVTDTGYVAPESISITADLRGTLQNVDVTLSIQRIRHSDDNNSAVARARLQVKDSEGNVVDSWISGQHLLDMSEDTVNTLVAEGTVTISADEITNTLDNSVLDQGIEYINEAFKSMSESTDYNRSTYLHLAYELLPLSDSDLSTYVNKADSKLEEIVGITDQEKITSIREEVLSDFTNVYSEISEEVANTGYTTATIYEDITSSTGYTLRATDYETNVHYYDIDIDGNEGYHRVSNLKADDSYTVDISNEAGEYNQGSSIVITTRASVNGQSSIKATRKLELDSTSFKLKGWQISVIEGITLLVVIGFGIVVSSKKKTKNS